VTSLDELKARGAVPQSLHGILMDARWDLSKLWALDLPVSDVPTSALAWQLDLPWWRVDNRWFAVAPSEVWTHPSRYPEQWGRTMRADLGRPIHLRDTERGPVILDGVHRLLKAAVEGRLWLRAVTVPKQSLPEICTGPTRGRD
jgi:hypothetical protein